ncbi:MAG: hypothetical protein [Enterobacter phage ENC19]|nr:MAG: hypothetical protein [Enterobacter phage ENC19]
MSCPTWAHFENLKEDTQKRVFINLGWFAPTDFDIAEILVNASKEISDTYEWDCVRMPVLPGQFIDREKFEAMRIAVEGINSLHPPSLGMHYRQRFTLKTAWTKDKEWVKV